MLKVLMFMLCCTAQEMAYAHKIVKLCSKMCLTDHDTGLIFACKRSIGLDRLIGRVDVIDELAVLGMSLDSVGCSLSVDSLTET